MFESSWRVLVVAFTLAPLCAAQSVGELRVGHWVKVKGQLAPDGVFTGVEVEVLPPAGDESLTGTITDMKTPTRFVLLGQEVHVSQKTQWRGIAAGDLAGARVKVEGDYHGPRKFSADGVSRRDPGRDAIEARIDSIDHVAGELELGLLHVRVRLARDVKVISAVPLESLALAPQRVFDAPTAQRDEEDEVRGSFALGETLTIGGQLEYEYQKRLEQDLNDARGDDRVDQQASVRIEAVWEPNDALYVLASGRFNDQWRVDQDDPDEHDAHTTLNEGYAYWRDALDLGWDVQVGRQDFDERREWLYDQNLDALRLIHSRPDLRLELSASTTLSDGSDFDEESLYWIAYLSNNDFDRHLGAYVLDREEQGGGDRSTYLGARANGEWFAEHDVWLDAAYLDGESGGVDVGAFAFDVGTTWSPWSGGPWFNVGVAYGSGDDDASGTFRQPALADNTDKLGGVTSFQYYGELFDPELTNLGVITLGVGCEVARATSLDLVLHHYQQAEAVDQLVNTGLRRRPDGVHRELGWEADVVLGSRALRDWLLEVVVGYFDPGDAFPGADEAWLARFQLRYKF